ncbi:hypothetical protein [Dickeya oryzae]|uniref:hypothetical protein n=1 Tax=Dickeya oryzae TaxID=1240404 RepID=UPI001AECA9F7|nr:hypothetical protein [Dickeya oryzae]MBP2850512.1 hypothetical protein [Dickeya oryzae]
MPKHTEYCYSWDDESFNSGRFDSIDEAIADAVEASDDGDDGWKTHVYIGEVEPWNNSEFYPPASWVLEYMQEQAWGEAGDHADDYANVSIEARDELDQQLSVLLDSWCEKHGVAPQFFRVKKSSLYPLPVKQNNQG